MAITWHARGTHVESTWNARGTHLAITYNHAFITWQSMSVDSYCFVSSAGMYKPSGDGPVAETCAVKSTGASHVMSAWWLTCGSRVIYVLLIYV